VLPGSAASRAGLQPGDTLLSIDGRPLRHFSDLVSTLRNGEGKPVEIVLARGSERQTVQITPDRHPTENRWLIGINHPAELRRFSLVDSVRFGAGEVGYYIEGMVRGIPQIPAAVFKALSMQKQQDIGGPIVIAEMSKQAIESGLGGFITWLALFSVMLGIMNLLPIPLLDGGHLMFYAIEAIRGKPLDERKQEFAFKIGIAVIGTMMFAAFFSDVVGKLRLLF
jgi:regulator of sigma E protease